MKYLKPELVVLGPATVLVKGIPKGIGDSTNPFDEIPADGAQVGLDDGGTIRDMRYGVRPRTRA